jgi:hypothetical protein
MSARPVAVGTTPTDGPGRAGSSPIRGASCVRSRSTTDRAR